MTHTQPANYYVFSRGDRLRAARENTLGGPTQAEFAKILGVSRNTVSRYEAEEPGADKPIVFHRWAEVTGYDLDWLLRGTEPNDPTDESLTCWYANRPLRLAG
jgi:transcriptional regulator with XRE-family HTH domain